MQKTSKNFGDRGQCFIRLSPDPAMPISPVSATVLAFVPRLRYAVVVVVTELGVL